MLVDHTGRHPMRLWTVGVRSFNALVGFKGGTPAGGLEVLRGGIEQAGEAKFLPRFLLLLGELAACLGEAGEVALAIETVEGTLARCERRDERWYLPELLRIKGGLILGRGGPDATTNADEPFLT